MVIENLFKATFKFEKIPNFKGIFMHFLSSEVAIFRHKGKGFYNNLIIFPYSR